jgi:hypothetical protein
MQARLALEKLSDEGMMLIPAIGRQRAVELLPWPGNEGRAS